MQCSLCQRPDIRALSPQSTTISIQDIYRFALVLVLVLSCRQHQPPLSFETGSRPGLLDAHFLFSFHARRCDQILTPLVLTSDREFRLIFACRPVCLICCLGEPATEEEGCKRALRKLTHTGRRVRTSCSNRSESVLLSSRRGTLSVGIVQWLHRLRLGRMTTLQPSIKLSHLSYYVTLYIFTVYTTMNWSLSSNDDTAC